MHVSKVVSALAAAMLLFMDESTMSARANPLAGMKKLKCKNLVYVCADGVTKVYPNPFNGCEFDLCPEDLDEEEGGEDEDEDNDDDDDGGDDDDDSEDVDEVVTCEKIVHTCADRRTKVHPNPLNNCEFDPCPEDAVDDSDDVSIEDLIDEEATTAAPATFAPPKTTHHEESDIDDDDDNRDPDKPQKHSKSTTHPTVAPTTTAPAPKAVVWTSIDSSKAPAAVQEAVQQAFALYNSTQICDKLILYYDSIEAHNETTTDPLQHSKKKHLKKQHLRSFHVVVNVDCYLMGVKEVGGKFVLNLEQHGVNEAQPYQLTDCAHLETWSELSNWLAVRNNVGYCETPRQKQRFNLQPLRYVHYQAKTLTLLDTVVRNKNYLAIVAAVVGATAAIILLVVCVVLRRRYCGYRKLKMDGGDASPDCAIDEDIRLSPPNKRQNADTSKPASTFL